jgi:hypothetical protein
MEAAGGSADCATKWIDANADTVAGWLK